MRFLARKNRQRFSSGTFAQPNWGHPSMVGLNMVTAPVGGRFINALNGKPWTHIGSPNPPNYRAHEFGPGPILDGSGAAVSARIAVGSNPVDRTLFALTTPVEAWGIDQQLIGLTSDSNSPTEAVHLSSGFGSGYAMREWDGAAVDADMTGPPARIGEVFVGGYAARSGDKGVFFGRRDHLAGFVSSRAAGTFYSTWASGPFWNLAYYSGGNKIGYGIVAGWTRAISAPEAQALMDAPFDLLQPAGSSLLRWLRPSVGGGPATYTLAAASTILGLAAQAATLRLNRRLNAQSNSAAIASIAANLLYGRRISAAVTTTPITQTAATFHLGRLMVASSVTVPIAQTAAGLRLSRRLAALSASLPISAQNAGMLYTRKLTAASITIPINVSAATLTKTLGIIAQSTVVALSAQSASLKAFRRLNAQTLNVPLTVIAATLSYGKRLSALGTTLPLSAQSATLHYNIRRVLSAESVSVSLAVGAAGLRFTRRLQALSVGVDITPQIVALRYSGLIAPYPENVIRLTGSYDPEIQLSATYQPVIQLVSFGLSSS